MGILKRGSVTTAALLGHRLMGGDLPPMSLKTLPIRGAGSDGKWQVTIYTRMNQDLLKIEECVPHKGAVPHNLHRFVAVVDGMTPEGQKVTQRLPIQARNLDEAFALFKAWLTQVMEEQKKRGDKAP